jgi:putative transcriptional regulator
MTRNTIRTLRTSCGISQEQLADQIGVTRQTVISLEKERYNPSLELAFRIARFFNTGVEDVFAYEER